MPDLPSGLSEVVGEDEDLARFLHSSGDYSGTVVKPAAFLPYAKYADKETSVFRHGAEPRPDLWKIASDHIVLGQGRRIHGAAIFKARHVYRALLTVVADKPPSRHAGIRGWPWIPDCVFRRCQPPVPVDVGHRFRLKKTTVPVETDRRFGRG